MASPSTRRRRLSRRTLGELKERMTEARTLRRGRFRARITVHMGTCGLASGAQVVHDAVVLGTVQSGLSDVEVSTSGCIGLCSEEPLVTVEVLGMEPIVYRQVTAAVMVEIVHDHVRNGTVVLRHALMRGLPVDEDPPPEPSPRGPASPRGSPWP